MQSVHLLLVEDDLLVADIVADALTEAGYEVARATDGDEGAELLAHYAADLRGLIVDVAVARPLDGWALAQSARERHPQIAVIYLAGENPDRWAADGVPASLIITKPFAPGQIVSAIASLLNQSGLTTGEPQT